MTGLRIVFGAEEDALPILTGAKNPDDQRLRVRRCVKDDVLSVGMHSDRRLESGVLGSNAGEAGDDIERLLDGRQVRPCLDEAVFLSGVGVDGGQIGSRQLGERVPDHYSCSAASAVARASAMI
mgnify:CR=1 FL=1